MSHAVTIGEHLRAWRQRRRLSQLDLAVEAEISARHLSFLETGRSQPSREMVLHLAEQLEVPLRDRNMMLVAAGFAPVFPERPLDDPALQPARQAVDLVLAGHEPYPALAVDRHWILVSANGPSARLMGDVAPELLAPPVNVMRVALHPNGLAPRTVNLPEWRAHLLHRLRRQLDLTADAAIAALLEELRAYPVCAAAERAARNVPSEVAAAVPFQLRTDAGTLSFISTTMLFGTPIDVTLAELAIETFFPADPATAAAMRQMQEAISRS